MFPGRSLAQIRSHYHNKLKDTTEKDSWSREEDKKLLTYVEIYGYDWLRISKIFNNRFTRTGCRTRFYTISRHLAKCPSNTIENVPSRKRQHNKTNININNWMNKLHELPNLSQEKPKSVSKRTIKQYYVDRLRANEKCFYEYFKYSFEYYYGNDFDYLFTEFETLQHISKALEYEEIFSVSDDYPQKLPHIVFENLLCLAQYNNWTFDSGFNLPPSWGTILGLRSLFIFKSSPMHNFKSTNKKVKIEEDISKIDDNELECHKLLFKTRFRSAFFKASLLSLLHSAEFKPNCSIQVIGKKDGT